MFIFSFLVHLSASSSVTTPLDLLDICNSSLPLDLVNSVINHVPALMTNTRVASLLQNGQNTSYGSEYELCTSEPFYNQPNAALCGGILVGPDRLLTSPSCMQNYSCGNISAVFGYYLSYTEGGSCVMNQINQTDVYNCVSYMTAPKNALSTAEDMIVIFLDRPVPSYTPINHSLYDLQFADHLNVFGYPFGLPLKYSAESQSLHSQNGSFTLITTSTAQSAGSLVTWNNQFIGVFDSPPVDYIVPNASFSCNNTRRVYCNISSLKAAHMGGGPVSKQDGCSESQTGYYLRSYFVPDNLCQTHADCTLHQNCTPQVRSVGDAVFAYSQCVVGEDMEPEVDENNNTAVNVFEFNTQYSNTTITNSYLRDVYSRDLIFENTYLHRVVLNDTFSDGGEISDSEWIDSNFTSVVFFRISILQTALSHVYFENVFFNFSSFENSTFHRFRFDSSSIFNTSFNASYLVDVHMDRTTFIYVDVVETAVEECYMEEFIIQDTDFVESLISDSYFTQSLVEKSYLHNTQFRDTVLHHALFNSSRFMSTTFQNISLYNVGVIVTQFWNTSFSEMSLYNGSVDSASLNQVTFNRSSLNLFNFSRIQLTDLEFHHFSAELFSMQDSYITYSKWEGGDVRETFFENVHMYNVSFINVDMRRVNVRNVSLRNIVFDNVTFEEYMLFDTEMSDMVFKDEYITTEDRYDYFSSQCHNPTISSCVEQFHLNCEVVDEICQMFLPFISFCFSPYLDRCAEVIQCDAYYDRPVLVSTLLAAGVNVDHAPYCEGGFRPNVSD